MNHKFIDEWDFHMSNYEKELCDYHDDDSKKILKWSLFLFNLFSTNRFYATKKSRETFQIQDH